MRVRTASILALLLTSWAAAFPLPAPGGPRAAFLRSASKARGSEGHTRAGWRVFVDPQTGKLREPTREEALELSRATMQRSGQPILFEVVTHADGTRSVDLRDAFEMHLVARRNPDGSISMECVRSVVGERTAKGGGSGSQETRDQESLTESTGRFATKSKEKH